MTHQDQDAPSLLRQAIRERAVVLPHGMLKVDAFLNHQVDPQLLGAIGAYLAEAFRNKGVTKVLTAESSGIAPAVMVGVMLGVPIVFAKRALPVTMAGVPVFTEATTSPTKGGWVDLFVSSEVLKLGDLVLIIDDFLASGQTIRALLRIIQQGGGQPVGVGVVIEKASLNGRALIAKDFPEIRIVSVATITGMSRGGTINFA